MYPFRKAGVSYEKNMFEKMDHLEGIPCKIKLEKIKLRIDDFYMISFNKSTNVRILGRKQNENVSVFLNV